MPKACGPSAPPIMVPEPTPKARMLPAASARAAANCWPRCTGSASSSMRRIFRDECFWEALDVFPGRVWASHNNVRAIVPDTRQFTDEQIRASSTAAP